MGRPITKAEILKNLRWMAFREICYPWAFGFWAGDGVRQRLTLIKGFMCLGREVSELDKAYYLACEERFGSPMIFRRRDQYLRLLATWIWKKIQKREARENLSPDGMADSPSSTSSPGSEGQDDTLSRLTDVFETVASSPEPTNVPGCADEENWEMVYLPETRHDRKNDKSEDRRKNQGNSSKKEIIYVPDRMGLDLLRLWTNNPPPSPPATPRKRPGQGARIPRQDLNARTTETHKSASNAKGDGSSFLNSLYRMNEWCDEGAVGTDRLGDEILDQLGRMMIGDAGREPGIMDAGDDEQSSEGVDWSHEGVDGSFVEDGDGDDMMEDRELLSHAEHCHHSAECLNDTDTKEGDGDSVMEDDVSSW